MYVWLLGVHKIFVARSLLAFDSTATRLELARYQLELLTRQADQLVD
jgi:hypothetical protein